MLLMTSWWMSCDVSWHNTPASSSRLLHERHERIGDIHITAWDGEGVRLFLVHENEMKGEVILGVGDAFDLIRAIGLRMP